MAELSELIKKHALLNAVQHGGKASEKAVLGKVLGENAELKKEMKRLAADIKKIVGAVNRLSLEAQQKEIEKLGVAVEKKESKRELPPLPHAEGQVVMRFAPNPDGPLSLGRSRQALLNWWYVKKYRGSFVLRFDDTDPKIKTPIKEAYDWIEKDLKWLGVEPSLVVRASERLDVYYKFAEQMIKEGGAYVCLCTADDFKSYRTKGLACPDREMEVEEQVVRWKNLFRQYKEGQAVVRIKTDMIHKNPAIRDWPALRIVDNPKHPFSKARVWPLYDFASAIDDHELGITHVIRGRDFEMSEVKQGFVYQHFGWSYPHNIVTGKMMVAGVKSTSEARRMIEEGKVDGWDDPRLPTLMALRRRGFEPDAIKQFIFDAGLTKGDTTVSMETLETINRKLIDAKTNRYFFVADPVEVEVSGAEPQLSNPPLHPEDEKRGHRELHFKQRVLVSRDDLQSLKKGSSVRLKNLFTIKVRSDGEKITADFVSKAKEKGLQIIHWLPVEEKVPLVLKMPDGSSREGFAEPAAAEQAGRVVQFERVGFARLEKLNKILVAYYTHR